MNRNKALLVSILLVSFGLAACSGKPGGVICKVNCGGGGSGGTFFVTMVADTLPPNPAILTFKVTITGIALISAAGAQQALPLNGTPIVDLMRLQSDTAFLGTFTNIPAGQYIGVVVSFSNPVLTFFNDTANTLQGCLPNTVCTQFSPVNSAAPQTNVNFSVSSTNATGIGLELELAHIAIISGNNLTVNFANPQVLFAFALPRPQFFLPAGQLDLIEDFTGVVSISNSNATLTSATATGRGAITATATTSTIFNADPTGNLCKNPSLGVLTSCVASNQAASMDVILKTDGTISIQEIEPLLATLQDTVEGIVVINPNNSTQFTMVVTDLIPAAANSLIGSLKIGDGLIVNLAANPTFNVDTKGLTVLNGVLSNFAGQTSTSAIFPGQSVAVHVSAFTAATQNTFASANNTDTVTLRWSRFTATPQTAATPAFSITALPSYFAFTQASIFNVQTTTGTPGTLGVTNFDGVSDASSLNTARPVALRALFLENPGFTASPAFTAAKIRQH
jgi:hypothetical protein